MIRLCALLVCVVFASVASAGQPMGSASYSLEGGSLASAAHSALREAGPPVVGVGPSGVSLSGSFVGGRMTAPSGITLDPGLWPQLAVPEPGGFAGTSVAILMIAAWSRRRE